MPAKRHRRGFIPDGCIRCSRFFEIDGRAGAAAGGYRIRSALRSISKSRTGRLLTMQPFFYGRSMSFWLIKSEPGDISVDDVAAMPQQTVCWTGIRNYQARNFMRDRMRPGDGAFFYHSSCAEPGIVGVAEITSLAFPDPTQFDTASYYFDPKATPETPRWFSVDLRLRRRTRLLPLKTIRQFDELEGMPLLARGNRLSISPVEPGQWRYLLGKLTDV
jgi:predicted RNA-binding protein with PUA-like domain